MFIDDLEEVEINIKNKLYGWANKNGKALEFTTLEEKFESGRRIFTIGATVDGALVAQAKDIIKRCQPVSSSVGSGKAGAERIVTSLALRIKRYEI